MRVREILFLGQVKYDKKSIQCDFDKAWTWPKFSSVYSRQLSELSVKSFQILEKAILTKKPQKLDVSMESEIDQLVFQVIANANAGLLHSFKEVFTKMGPSVPVATAAKMMGITEDDLLAKLLVLRESLPFTLNNGVLEVPQMEDFMATLEKKFAEWTSLEKTDKKN